MAGPVGARASPTRQTPVIAAAGGRAVDSATMTVRTPHAPTSPRPSGPQGLRFVASVGLLLAALLTTACPGEPRLVVRVCSDLDVPTELDGVRVTALDAKHEQQTFAGVVQLINCEAGKVQGLPIEYDAVPGPAPFWIVVEGLSKGIVIVTVEARVSRPIDNGETLVVPVSLRRDCQRLLCPLGQTCLEGACQVTPFHDEAPQGCISPPLPDVPAAADAGQPDPGPAPDVGPTDIPPVPDALCNPGDLSL